METRKELTPEQSLDIIQKTLEQSRAEMERESGRALLTWGIWVALFALVIGHLWQHSGHAAWNLLWFAMGFIGFAFEWYRSRSKPYTGNNFVGRVIGRLWLSFAIFAMSVPWVIGIVIYAIMQLFDVSAVTGVSVYSIPITPIIVLMLGLCTTAMGFIIRNGWIAAGGIVSGLIGASAAIALQGPYEMLVMAAVAIVGLVIPGFMIRWNQNR